MSGQRVGHSSFSRWSSQSQRGHKLDMGVISQNDGGCHDKCCSCGSSKPCAEGTDARETVLLSNAQLSIAARASVLTMIATIHSLAGPSLR
jgi:hypothetical protein